MNRKMERGREGSRILIVQHDRAQAEWLQSFFSAFGDVEIAHTLKAGARAMQGAKWDGLVLDAELRDGKGLDLLVSLRKSGLDTPALVLADRTDDRQQKEAVLNHAFYVRKPATRALLRSFLRWVRKWKGYHRIPLSVAVENFVQQHDLTEQQAEILHLAAEGLLRQEIAQELGLRNNTVKTHVRRLLQRTGHKSIRDVLRELNGHGAMSGGPVAGR